MKMITTSYLWHNSMHAGTFFGVFLSSAVFFSILTFCKKSLRNTTTVSNSLDPDQARRS